MERDNAGFDVEKPEDGTSWKVFYVVSPDGLCYWLGERLKVEGAAEEVSE